MTYKQLISVMQTLVANIENQETKTQKKLVKIHQKLMTYYNIYQEKVNENKLEYAEVDDKGFLILDEKSEFKHSKEGMKKLIEANKALLNSDFDYEVIEVLNPSGLEEHVYLKNFVKGVMFHEEDTDTL
jgi:hypothetical protein